MVSGLSDSVYLFFFHHMVGELMVSEVLHEGSKLKHAFFCNVGADDVLGPFFKDL